MKKFAMILVSLVFSFVCTALNSGTLYAEVASYNQATTYTDGSPKDVDDNFTTSIFEGTSNVCSSSTSTCAFSIPCSPYNSSGTLVSHTYNAKTRSSKYSTDSAASNSVVYNAPMCAGKTPSPPQLLTITVK